MIPRYCDTFQRMCGVIIIINFADIASLQETCYLTAAMVTDPGKLKFDSLIASNAAAACSSHVVLLRMWKVSLCYFQHIAQAP